jgi:hypothetical protein
MAIATPWPRPTVARVHTSRSSSVVRIKGEAMGRGLDHFRREGAKLVPPPTDDDPYEGEAYRLWAIKQRSK